MLITSKLLLNGQHQLMCDGETVGRAWRYSKGSNGKRPGGFGVAIDGFYWRAGQANVRGGSSGTSTKTLKQALLLVAEVLSDPALKEEQAKKDLEKRLCRSTLDESTLRELFERIWDQVLVPIAGTNPHPDRREGFILDYIETKYPATEWRFQGSLGFGGKFWMQDNLKCSVSCYREDETPEREKTIAKANLALSALVADFKEEVTGKIQMAKKYAVEKI